MLPIYWRQGARRRLSESRRGTSLPLLVVSGRLRRRLNQILLRGRAEPHQRGPLRTHHRVGPAPGAAAGGCSRSRSRLPLRKVAGMSMALAGVAVLVQPGVRDRAAGRAHATWSAML